MPEASEQFLQNYAKAFEQNDPALAASFCLLPTLVVSDDRRAVFEDRADLIASFQGLIDILDTANVVKHEPEIKKFIRLSPSIIFINMRWQFYDENAICCLTCSASYTLQKLPGGELKIIIAVLDDDKSIQKLFRKNVA
jgi:hypothetical protein